MHWIWLTIIGYLVVLLLVCLRVIFETHSSTKTLAYLLFCIFIPVIGMGFYLTFGINYWKIKVYSKKSAEDEHLLKQLKKNIPYYSQTIVAMEEVAGLQNAELAAMLIKDLKSPLTRYNKVKLLLNGEENFRKLIVGMENEKKHIHRENYIYE